MSRIRTIKPEFWTDEKIVQLPFSARLLFIGMWNFVDDDGYIVDEAEAIRLQVLPNDVDVDVDEHLDLLWSMGLIERLADETGRDLIRIANFDRHQRISHKTKSRFKSEGVFKKANISTPLRRALAEKYGCKPGEEKDVECYSCGTPGRIYWHRLRNGRPSAWVTFSLEIDHGIPEACGGETDVKNMVLSCRYCNRSRGKKPLAEFTTRALRSAPENSGAFTEPSALNGREGKGKESIPERQSRSGEGDRSDPEKSDDGFETWYDTYPRHVAPAAARKRYREALKKTDAATLLAAAEKARQVYAGKDPQYIPLPSTWLNGEYWRTPDLALNGANGYSPSAGSEDRKRIDNSRTLAAEYERQRDALINEAREQGIESEDEQLAYARERIQIT